MLAACWLWLRSVERECCLKTGLHSRKFHHHRAMFEMCCFRTTSTWLQWGCLAWAAKQKQKFCDDEVSPQRGPRNEFRNHVVPSPRNSKMNDKELHKMTEKKQLRARRGWSLPLLGPLLLCCMPCVAAASLSETTGRSLELCSIDQFLDRPFGPPKLIKRSAIAMAPCARLLGNWTPTTDGVSCLYFEQ